MKISTVRIQNFRSFQDETVSFDDYTCLVGANGCGKSNVLMALNIFFRNSQTNFNATVLTQDDFHHKNIKDPIVITITFEDLSDEAKNDFKDYYRQGKLIVSAVANWNLKDLNAPVEQYGSRLAMKKFAEFFARYAEKADVLKEIYAEIRKEYADLPKLTGKDAMATALREYEESHLDLCALQESSDQFYGFTKGGDRLAKYIQWVYIPAVKDASTEQDENKKTALGQLLERTVRTKVKFGDSIQLLRSELAKQYKAMVEAQAESLETLSNSLQLRLQEWSHPGAIVNLKWHYDEGKSISVSEPFARVEIGEDKFIGEVARLGHGVQRSFLVSILQELSFSDDEGSPKLILGFEEPELYQHPPQARHMAGLLEALSSRNSQIIITTHSPYFVPGNGYQSVRMVRKDLTSCDSKVKALLLANYEKIISDALGTKPLQLSKLIAETEQVMQPSLKELFFTPVAILVEGLQDVAFISTYLKLLDKWTDFRAFNCHFVVTQGKTNMSRPLAIALGFGIPAFAVFDADADQTKTEDKERNSRDNRCLLNLCSMPKADPLPKEIVIGESLVMWPANIDESIKESFGASIYDDAKKKILAKNGWEGISNKNALVAVATIEELWTQEKRSTILEKACDSIIQFAKKVSGKGLAPLRASASVN